MEKSRRDFLTLTAAGATVLAASESIAGDAPAQPVSAQPTIAVPADKRLRLISYRAKPGGPAQVGVVKANGHIFEIPSATSPSMLALIEAGPAALEDVRR